MTIILPKNTSQMGLDDWLSCHKAQAIPATQALNLCSEMSRLNIEQHQGGPFAALLADHEGKLCGAGCNHVTSTGDPSTHAEVEAIRMAHQRGVTDFSQTVLYTSCECCPMCLSLAKSVGINRIYYLNRREDAGAIGFSDAAQYALLRQPVESLMHQLAANHPMNQHLLTHEAVLLHPDGSLYADDAPNAVFPTLPSLQALLNGLRRYQDETGTASPHLPFGFRLVCRQLPHPMSFVCADWAGLLRASAVTPAVNNAILYQQQTAEIIDPAIETPLLYQLFQQEHITGCERFEDEGLQNQALSVFQQWQEGCANNQYQAY